MIYIDHIIIYQIRSAKSGAAAPSSRGRELGYQNFLFPPRPASHPRQGAGLPRPTRAGTIYYNPPRARQTRASSRSALNVNPPARTTPASRTHPFSWARRCRTSWGRPGERPCHHQRTRSSPRPPLCAACTQTSTEVRFDKTRPLEARRLPQTHYHLESRDARQNPRIGTRPTRHAPRAHAGDYHSPSGQFPMTTRDTGAPQPPKPNNTHHPPPDRDPINNPHQQQLLGTINMSSGQHKANPSKLRVASGQLITTGRVGTISIVARVGTIYFQSGSRRPGARRCDSDEGDVHDISTRRTNRGDTVSPRGD